MGQIQRVGPVISIDADTLETPHGTLEYGARNEHEAARIVTALHIWFDYLLTVQSAESEHTAVEAAEHS